MNFCPICGKAILATAVGNVCACNAQSTTQVVMSRASVIPDDMVLVKRDLLERAAEKAEKLIQCLDGYYVPSLEKEMLLPDELRRAAANGKAGE